MSDYGIDARLRVDFLAMVAIGGDETRFIWGRNDECSQAIGDLLAAPTMTSATHLLL